MDRNLDGYYFRVCRNGCWESVCFSDLTEEQMNEVLKDRSDKWLKSLCVGLGMTLKQMGDAADVIGTEE